MLTELVTEPSWSAVLPGIFLIAGTFIFLIAIAILAKFDKGSGDD